MVDKENINVSVLSFGEVTVPDFKEVTKTGQEFVDFGEANDFPDKLIELANTSAKHGAILSSKADYIFGGGLKADQDTPQTQQFIKLKSKLVKKIIKDRETHGGGYLQLIPMRGGTGFVAHHLTFGRVRTNANASKFFYKKDWTKRWQNNELKTWPAYRPGIKQVCVLMHSEEHLGSYVYPLPGYLHCLPWIQADAEVAKATLNNAKSGFSASKYVSFPGAEPTEAAKKIIENKFLEKFTGAKGSKVILAWHPKPEFKPEVLDLGASDLTKEDFEQVDNLISSNLYAGHKITNAALFGIPPKDHSLGGNAGAELRVSYDLFKNTYVNAKQKEVEDIINFIAELAGIKVKFTLIDTEPVGYVFSESLLEKIAPRSWLMEKLGIDSTKYPDAPVGGDPQPPATSGAMVNETLRNMTGKQQQQLLRIIRQFTKQQITEAVARIQLKSFNFSDEEIAQILGLDEQDNFGSDEDVAQLFAAHGEPRSNYASFEKRKVETFADDKTYKDVEDKINAVRTKNPKATAASIAKQLNIDESLVSDYLNGNTGGSGGTGLKLPKFKIMYSYEKRPDVTGPAVIPGTRPFCRKMLAMDKLYTREDIQKISQYLGYDVMRRAGGFWNNDGTIEYHCRHEFFSQIVVKVK